MSRVRSRTAAVLLAVFAAACGSATSETITGTTPEQRSSLAPAPTTAPATDGLTYAPDGEALFSTRCEAVEGFVLTRHDEQSPEGLVKVFQHLKAVVAGDNPDLAADMDWIGDLVAGADMSEADEAEAVRILLPIDRGTYELCGIPMLSAIEHVSILRFCDGPDCEPVWATTLPCFDSAPAPGEQIPFEYTPIDCETGEEIELDEDGEWTPVPAR